MEEKRFGVKISRLKDLKLFQLSLRKKRKKMLFIGQADVSVNNGPVCRDEVQSNNGQVSIGIYMRSVRVPSQTLLEMERRIVITLCPYITVAITFDTCEEKASFLGALGDVDIMTEEEDDPRGHHETTIHG